LGRGVPDIKENYLALTYKLDYEGNKTALSLSQDNNDNEKAVEHSRENWEKMLIGLKQVLE
jgi:hypothetical protein